MLALGPSFLAFLGDVVAPLGSALSRAPSSRAKSLGDRAVGEPREASGSAPGAANEQGAGSAVAEVIATAQLCAVEASPPLVRTPEAGGARWLCTGQTSLVIRTADGREREMTYAAGTVLIVDGGLLHLPPAAAQPA